MNRIKKEMKIPDFFQYVNISCIYKNKGVKSDLNNHRGIFRVPVLRQILDSLIYNDEYDTVDSFMSDSNIGGRKERSIRNHLFIV